MVGTTNRRGSPAGQRPHGTGNTPGSPKNFGRLQFCEAALAKALYQHAKSTVNRDNRYFVAASLPCCDTIFAAANMMRAQKNSGRYRPL
jgi:hypothetical protein